MSAEFAAPAALSTPVTMRELVDAGCHFGHQTRRWHPAMKPFLYGERNGIHIIDLSFTLPRLREAIEFVEDIRSIGKGEGGFAEDHEYFGELANI